MHGGAHGNIRAFRSSVPTLWARHTQHIEHQPDTRTKGTPFPLLFPPCHCVRVSCQNLLRHENTDIFVSAHDSEFPAVWSWVAGVGNSLQQRRHSAVGENDAGKSSVIDALRLVLQTRDGEYVRLQPYDSNEHFQHDICCSLWAMFTVHKRSIR